MRPNPADIYAAPVDDSRMGRLEYSAEKRILGECTALKLTESANAGVRPTTLQSKDFESAELLATPYYR